MCKRGLTLAKALDGRVPEGIDRLERVADREEVVSVERADDPHLARVRVLELIDHQQIEALPRCRGDLRVLVKQPCRGELQVVEIGAAAGLLEQAEAPCELRQQLVQEGDRSRREVIRERLGEGLACRVVGVGLRAVERVAAARQLELGDRERAGAARTQDLVAALEAVQCSPHGGGHRRLRERMLEFRTGACQARGRGGEVRSRRRLGKPRRFLAAAATLVEDRKQRASQLIDAERGSEVERLRSLLPAREGLPEGLLAQARPLGVVEHDELGRDRRKQRVGAQEPQRERMEGRDRRCGSLVRGGALAGVEQCLAHAAAQLPGGAIGERDRKDPARWDAVLADGAHEALDEHARLAAASVRGQRERTLPVADRDELLVAQPAHRRPVEVEEPRLPDRAHAAPTRQIAG